MIFNRILAEKMAFDLSRQRMVFIGGPRQVGKTTLSLSFLKHPSRENPNYFSFDSPLDRQKMANMEFSNDEEYLIFDELHKMPLWSNYIKGVYDTYKEKYKIIVTGSARLDHYAKDGDSLVGRYRYYRLHPLTLFEPQTPAIELDNLMRFSGFPEPLSEASSSEYRRWQKNRLRQVVRDDLRDLEEVKDISKIDLLIDALPGRVCSPLSVNALAQDLAASPKSVARCIEFLEHLYVCFPVLPFGAERIKAVKKEKKYYLWDWAQNTAPGALMENLVASHLLCFCHIIEDTQGFTMELRYLRDVERREIDFVVIQDKKPLFAVEVKNSLKTETKVVDYFRQRTDIKKFYQVHMDITCDIGDETANIRRLSLPEFCNLVAAPLHKGFL